jgi:hypothetical protein
MSEEEGEEVEVSKSFMPEEEDEEVEVSKSFMPEEEDEEDEVSKSFMPEEEDEEEQSVTPFFWEKLSFVAVAAGTVRRDSNFFKERNDCATDATQAQGSSFVVAGCIEKRI